MKTQQQAEKEEQQRIKNLVLNYDLQQNEDQESSSIPICKTVESEPERLHLMQAKIVLPCSTTTAMTGSAGIKASAPGSCN